MREERQRLRARDTARAIGISELELVASMVGADIAGGEACLPPSRVRRVRAEVGDFLPRLERLGRVMALTRNDLFVHEKKGVYRNVRVSEHVAQVLDEDIDLRIFPSRWIHGLAVEAEARGRLRRSLQFFDAHGVAVHKIFLLDDSDVEAYEAVVGDLLHEDQSPEQTVESAPESEGERPDAEVDVAGIEEAWRAIEDTHDFFRILDEYEVTRPQAFRVVDDELARSVANSGLRTVLETASADEIPLMVFVRSPGTWQIHHGPVGRIVETPPWLNVLDPGFSLHAREEDIGATWVVRKPVDTGWVTSVEIFDEAGGLCALLFGVRHEGEHENEAWRNLAEGLG